MPVTFTHHMAWHMFLVAVAAPIVATMIRGTPWAPKPWRRRRLDPVRTAPALYLPLIACLIEFAVVWGWHLPAPHAAARHHGLWFAAEQLSFAAAALFLWTAILGGDERERSARAGTGVIALVLTFAHMTMLGVLIAMAPRELYGHTAGGLVDQQQGGAVMVLAGALIYPAAAVWLSRSLVAPRAAGGGSR
jgi:putative membrane protein